MYSTMTSMMQNWGSGACGSKGGCKGGWGGGGEGWGGGKGSKGGQSNGMERREPGPAPEPTGETFVGIIKSFNEKNNYGFITCEDLQNTYGVDCFFNGKYLGGQNPGDTVEFDVGLNQKGQP